MWRELNHIDTTLARAAQLAGALKVDPEGEVSRSVTELWTAFTTRCAIEPAVARDEGV